MVHDLFLFAGLVYTYSTGMKQHLYVNEPDLVREMNQCITLNLGKPSYITNKLSPMLGNGILRANGHSWAQQRKLVAAEFFMDKVKVLWYVLSLSHPCQHIVVFLEWLIFTTIRDFYAIFMLFDFFQKEILLYKKNLHVRRTHTLDNPFMKITIK